MYQARKNGRKLLSPALQANGFGCLMDHLGSIWNALGIMLFSLIKETDAAEKAV